MVERGDENPEIETAIGEWREGAEMRWGKKKQRKTNSIEEKQDK